MLKVFHSKILTAICIALFLPLSMLAQEIVISGRVIDHETEEGLMFAVVRIADQGTVTDANGAFSLNTASGECRLVTSYVGYQSDTTLFYANKDTMVLISLEQTGGLLYEVVVTGSKFEKNIGEETVSIEVLPTAFIENANNVTLEESIQKVPGVNVIDGQANIRGGAGFSYGAGSRVLLLMDDIPLLTADAAYINWNFIPIESIGQVEVIKGAASALYGSSALNGIIHVRTAYPTAEPETRVATFSGLYDTPSDAPQQWWSNDIPFYSGFSVLHKQRFGKLDLVAGGYGYAENSYLQGDYDRFGRLNLQTRYRFNNRLSAGINTLGQLNRSVSFFFWNNIDSGLLVPAENTLTVNRGTRWSVDPYVNYTDKSGNQHQLKGRFYKSDNATQSEQGVQSNLVYGEYQFQRRFPLIGLTLTAGVLAQQGNVTAELYGDTTYRSGNQAVYLQLDKRFFDRLQVNAGWRFEQNQLDALEESRPVLRVGANFKAAEFTFIRASWGEGYRFPTVAEKYVNTSVSLFNIFPNEDLESETGWTAELGVKQGLKVGDWQAFVDVSGFVSRYFNMMEFTFGYYPESGAIFPYGFKSLNIGNTAIRGGELSVSGSGRIGRLPLTLLAGYTYIDPVFQDFDSTAQAQSTADFNVLKYRFRHVVKFDMMMPFKKWTPGIEVNYNSYMEAIDQAFNAFIPGLEDFREINNEGEFVVNIRLQYHVNEQSSVNIVCNNLFNNLYTLRPAYVEPIRNFAIRFNHTL